LRFVDLFTSAVPADGDRSIQHSPLGYRARVWLGDVLLADSADAVRVDEFDRAPTLYFPPADVRLDRLSDDGRGAVCPVKGPARVWAVDGVDVAWTITAGAAHGVSFLDELIAFDHDAVRVEVVDWRPGDDERDRTSKRFPTWGDAAHLVEMLDVKAVGDLRYESVARSTWFRPIVEGSQMLAQSMVACARETGGRRVVSAHMVFYRAADARRGLTFVLEPVSAGRTFNTFVVHVHQGARRCATGTLLLDASADDVMRHEVGPPDTAGPYEAVPFDMSVTGRDLRVVDDAYTGDPAAPVGPAVLDAWVRFRQVPADQPMHDALLAQFAGHMPIAAAMRPHDGIGQDQAHRTISTAINAIALSIHADVRADRWMLYRHLSTFAGDGMTHAECRVHDEAGRLLASFTVDAMVRGFRPGTGAVDDRTAM
jgi:acyl-CoA thioesterase II